MPLSSIAFMLLSTFSLSVTSLLVKLLSDTLPADILNSARFFFPTLVMVPLLFMRRTGLPQGKQWLVIALRGCSLLFSQMCLLYAMQHASYFEAVVLFSTGPLFMALIEALVFRARLSGLTLFSLLLAFSGVVIQTGGGEFTFSAALVVGLGAGFFNAISQLVMHRMIRAGMPNLGLNGLSLAAAWLISLPMITSHSVTLAADNLTSVTIMMLLAMGLTISSSQTSRAKAYRTAESSSLLSPLIFTNLVFAFIWQLMLFNESFSTTKVMGLTIIVAACLLRSLEPLARRITVQRLRN
uniref:DMT family transporter n=1 Tax=Thaumasiovibrio occultus TaxID=1891184 RepID=UPI000B34FF31|nr:DMT family transporter [Thaumasiovibrio occultus]